MQNVVMLSVLAPYEMVTQSLPNELFVYLIIPDNTYMILNDIPTKLGNTTWY
jgi:hypothetical protein